MKEIVFQFMSSDRSTPETVECLNLKMTVSISCGERHTAVLTKVTTVYSHILLILNDCIKLCLKKHSM